MSALRNAFLFRMHVSPSGHGEDAFFGLSDENGNAAEDLDVAWSFSTVGETDSMIIGSPYFSSRALQRAASRP